MKTLHSDFTVKTTTVVKSNNELFHIEANDDGVVITHENYGINMDLTWEEFNILREMMDVVNIHD